MNLIQRHHGPLGRDPILGGRPMAEPGIYAVLLLAAAEPVVDECHFASRVGTQDWFESAAEGGFAARGTATGWKTGAGENGFAGRNTAGDWRTEKEC